jgi:hypothetical protein
MNRSLVALFAVALMLACSGVAFAAIGDVLYSQDFNVDDTANWTVNDSGLSDILVDFFYDYSAGIGVPAAPNGTGTVGLKMTANNSGGVFSGFSVSPTGESFSGSYQLAFDLWQNYVGPLGPGGSGTTQLSQFGIGTAGNVAMWPGAATKESVTFAATLDGGSAADYRLYSSAFPTSAPSGTTSVYAPPGGSNNDTNPYYMSRFGGESAPGDQLTAFAGQTGSTSLGEISFDWRAVTIDVANDVASWRVDGELIAQTSLAGLTLGGGNILFGHSDTNAGSSADANDTLLNVTLIDNVRVIETPEPTSALLLLLGAVGAVRGRRNRR